LQQGLAKLAPVVRNKWTSNWDSNWFYYMVPLEQVPDVQGKWNYPLRSMMTPLDYLTDALFECSPGDVNVGAYTETTSIIGGCDIVEEFLACGIWPLREKFEFEVEMEETPLSKVMVPMLKVTPTIGNQELEAALEAQIVVATNLLVGIYNVEENNAYIGLQHG
jgi:hypothetical protein